MKTDDLIALLARQPDALPRPPLRRDWILASLVGLAAAFAVMAAVLGVRPDLDAASASPLFWQKVLALALLAAFSGWAAFRSGMPGRGLGPGRSVRWAVPAWLLVATAFTVWAAPTGGAWALFISPTILVCLSMIPLLAVIPALALGWALKRAAPTEPAQAARAIGWAAGGIGAFVYAFHCQADQPAYVLVWYGAAVAITVVLVQAIASRWLRW